MHFAVERVAFSRSILPRPAVNSALHRARAMMRERLPAPRSEWAPSAAPSRDEQAVLRRYMSALARGDLAAMAQLLADDVRTSMPPWPMWFQGRDSVIAALTAQPADVSS